MLENALVRLLQKTDRPLVLNDVDNLEKAMTERRGHWRRVWQVPGKKVWVTDHSMNYEEGQGELFSNLGRASKEADQHKEQLSLFDKTSRESSQPTARKPLYLYKKTAPKKPREKTAHGSVFTDEEALNGPLFAYAKQKPQAPPDDKAYVEQLKQKEEVAPPTTEKQSPANDKAYVEQLKQKDAEQPALPLAKKEEKPAAPAKRTMTLTNDKGEKVEIDIPKSPHEIRRDDYARENWQSKLQTFRDRPDILDNLDREKEIAHFKQLHVNEVGRALREGKHVPDEVLQDYPVLRERVEKEKKEQQGISERLKQQKTQDAEHEFNGVYQKLMGAKQEDVANAAKDVTPEHAKKVLERLDAAPGDNPAVRKAMQEKLAPKQEKPLEESDTDKTKREWRENYARVMQNPREASDQDIHRALGLISHVRTNEGAKAQRGEPHNDALFDSMGREEEGLKQILRERAENTKVVQQPEKQQPAHDPVLKEVAHGVLKGSTMKPLHRGRMREVLGASSMSLGDKSLASAYLAHVGEGAAHTPVEEKKPVVLAPENKPLVLETKKTPEFSERVKSAMKDVREESQRLQAYGDRMQAGPGIPVGSEGAFHPAIAQSMSDMLRELGNGKSLDEAHAIASHNLRDYVQKTNDKRKDINWKRDAEHGQDKLAQAKQKLATAFQEPPATPDAAKQPWELGDEELKTWIHKNLNEHESQGFRVTHKRDAKQRLLDNPAVAREALKYREVFGGLEEAAQHGGGKLEALGSDFYAVGEHGTARKSLEHTQTYLEGRLAEHQKIIDAFESIKNPKKADKDRKWLAEQHRGTDQAHYDSNKQALAKLDEIEGKKPLVLGTTGGHAWEQSVEFGEHSHNIKDLRVSRDTLTMTDAQAKAVNPLLDALQEKGKEHGIYRDQKGRVMVASEHGGVVYAPDGTPEKRTAEEMTSFGAPPIRYGTPQTNGPELYQRKGLPSAPQYKREDGQWYAWSGDKEKGWVKLSGSTKDPHWNKHNVQSNYDAGQMERVTESPAPTEKPLIEKTLSEHLRDKGSSQADIDRILATAKGSRFFTDKETGHTITSVHPYTTLRYAQEHYDAVSNALYAGKTVSPEVLNDYPEMVEQHKKFKAEREDIPHNVKTSLKNAIEATHILRDARKTDAQFGGNGRYEWEAYQEHLHKINGAHATIEKIQKQGERLGHGEKLKQFHEELGGVEQLSDAAKQYGGLTVGGEHKPLVLEPEKKPLVLQQQPWEMDQNELHRFRFGDSDVRRDSKEFEQWATDSGITRDLQKPSTQIGYWDIRKWARDKGHAVVPPRETAATPEQIRSAVDTVVKRGQPFDVSHVYASLPREVTQHAANTEAIVSALGEAEQAGKVERDAFGSGGLKWKVKDQEQAPVAQQSATAPAWMHRASDYNEPGMTAPVEMYHGLQTELGGTLHVDKNADGSYHLAHQGTVGTTPIRERATEAEALETVQRRYGGALTPTSRDFAKQHRMMVNEAVAQGKPVPDRVMEEYPDLKERGVLHVDREGGRFSARKGDRVKVWLNKDSSYHGTVAGISLANGQARIVSDDKPDGEGVWHDKGTLYPPDTEAPKVKEQPTAPLSTIVASVNKEPPGGWTDADKVKKPLVLGKETSASAGEGYTLEKHKATMKRLNAGEMTAEELKSAFREAKAGIATFKAELSAKPIKELVTGGKPPSGMKKADIVEKIAHRALESYHVGASGISWSPFSEKYEDALERHINKTTDEDIKNHVAAHAAAIEERKQRLAEYKSALDNPQTHEDYQRFIAAKGESALSPEQKVKWDELQAEHTRTQRAEQEMRQKATVGQVANLNDVNMSVVEHYHTKRGHNVHIVQMDKRVDRDVFNELSRKARMLGGNYSMSYKGSPAGFQFNTREQADQFIALKQGNVDRTETIQERQEQQAKDTAERLHNTAERMHERAQEELGKERLTNTARRADMAAGVEARARHEAAFAQTLHHIAEGIESGTVKHLKGVKAKTHLETLSSTLRSAMYRRDRAENKRHDEVEGRPPTQADIDYVKYPHPYVDRRTILQAVKHLRDKGASVKLLGARLSKLHGNQDEWIVADSPRVIEDMNTLVGKLRNTPGREAEHFADELAGRMQSYNRLQAADIKTEPELRAALREYLSLKSDAPKEDPIKKMERSLIGRNIEGFFPTPRGVIHDMLEDADIHAGMDVLEPSAGKGDIADAIKETVPDANLHVGELNYTLRDLLKAKGHNLVSDNFLEHEGKYDRIVMNPPFEQMQDTEHVRHAYNLLKPGGKLVSIMGESPFFRSDKKAVEFRNWLDSVGGQHERLPEGSFAGTDAFRQTGVNSRKVVIQKPYEEAIKKSHRPFVLGKAA